MIIENEQEAIEIKEGTEELASVGEVQNLIIISPKEEVVPESKKRRKIISRPFIESDSDSTDSDNLIIARSDDESQSNSTLEKVSLINFIPLRWGYIRSKKTIENILLVIF